MALRFAQYANWSFMVRKDFFSFDRSFRFTNLSSIVSASPVPILTTPKSLLLASSSSFSSLHLDHNIRF